MQIKTFRKSAAPQIQCSALGVSQEERHGAAGVSPEM